jgi:TolB-like protein
MENVRHAGLAFSIIIFLVGCNSTPIQQDNTINHTYSLDSAINEGSNYIVSRIKPNSKIAVVNIQSPTSNLTNYVIDSLLVHLVNDDKFFVIERSELNILENEQLYQVSGLVSDETAVSIGKQLGTQFIITGSMLPLDDKYSLRLKVLNVETAQIIGTKIFYIISDKILIALLTPSQNETPVEDNITQTTVIQGDVNIINNNTTTIQGDVYVNMPNGLGW